MTDPRALVDAYAEELDFERGDLNDDREYHAPKAFAALRAVLRQHPPYDGYLGEQWCMTCWTPGAHRMEPMRWPCPTAQAITRELEAK